VTTTIYAIVVLLPVPVYMLLVGGMIASDRIDMHVPPRRLVWCPELEPAPAAVKAVRSEWAADFAVIRIAMAIERTPTFGRPPLVLPAVAHREARQPMGVAA